MTKKQDTLGIGAGSTIEFELVGHAGELGKYRFYVRGQDVTSALAELLNVQLLKDNTVALEAYMDGPGQRFIQRVARKLHGFEKALFARQKASLSEMGNKSIILAQLAASQKPTLPGFGI